MKKFFSILLLAIIPLLSFASWSDPTVVLQQKHYQLGKTFSIDYYNAPQNAKLVIYPLKGSYTSPEVSVAVAAGKGSIETAVPVSAGKHAYYAALCTESKVVSDPVLFVADDQSGDISMTISQNVYTLNTAVTVTLKNAPACSGDKIVLYPASYTLVDNTHPKYDSPNSTALVTDSNCSLTLRSSTGNYFKIYYLLEGTYIPLCNIQDIMIGKPASINASKNTFKPEENITLNFSNLSKKFNDKIVIYPFTGNLNELTPLYTFNMKGRQKGSVSIPAGTLPDGTYRAIVMYNNSNNISVGSYARFTVSSKNSTLIYSDENTETYYNIINAADGKCMTTEYTASSTAKQKNMQLADFTESKAANEWRLVKRADGKTDIINRATGDYLLSTSSAQGNNNYTKMGTPEESTHNGFILANLADDQYTISSIEEDGIKRFLANVVPGDNALILNVKENSVFAWRLVEVETVTGINDVYNQQETVKVENSKIVVSGNQNYSIWNAQGIEQNKDAALQPGIYVVKWQDGRSAKISVK